MLCVNLNPNLFATQPLSRLSGIIKEEVVCRDESVNATFAWARFTCFKSSFSLPSNGSKGKENIALLPKSSLKF